jgi:aminopeptidase YwaD
LKQRLFILLLMAFVWRGVNAQDSAAIQSAAMRTVAHLTAPELHGRGYVSGGDSLAADYLIAEFQRMGLQPLNGQWSQSFSFPVNTFPDSMRLVLDGMALQAGKDFIVDPRSGSNSDNWSVVRLGLEDLQTPERRAMTFGVIAGSVIHLDLPANANKDTLAQYADWEEELVHYGPVIRPVDKLTWGVAPKALPNPIFHVRRELLQDTVLNARMAVNAQVVRKHMARNVFAVVPAKRNSGRWVLFTAHYDHLGRMGNEVFFPGANDNASGVAMLISLAEHFAKAPANVNLLFVAFAGEEAGLIGSEHFVSERTVDPTDISAVINLDIVGTGEEGIMVVNATQHPALYEEIVQLNATTGRLKEVRQRGPACNSDHCPFAKRGVPALFLYTLGGIQAYHDVEDRAETLPLSEFVDLRQLLIDLIAKRK